MLLFAGLTAYDTQKIKSMYAYVAGTDMMGKSVVMGALTLYLDFINMFQLPAQLHGQPPLSDACSELKKEARRETAGPFFLSRRGAAEEGAACVPRRVGGGLVVALGRGVVVEGVVDAVIVLEGDRLARGAERADPREGGLR